MVISLLFFFLGLIFGSFFNVVGLRVPVKQPFANERSICPHCKQQLSWYELIPVISFIIQKGKCRNCRHRISPIYPLFEMITGFLFSYAYIHLGISIELVIALLLISMLMILFVSDIRYMLIPDKVLIFFLPIFIVLRIIEPLEPWWSPFVGGLIGFIIIAVIILASNGGMGAGDMKLFGVLGIVLGIKNIVLTFLLACTIGAVFGVLLIMLKVVKRKQPIPFGPYIIIATLISYFYGEHIISWYLSFL